MHTFMQLNELRQRGINEIASKRQQDGSNPDLPERDACVLITGLSRPTVKLDNKHAM